MDKQKTKAFWLLILLAPLFAEVILGNTLAVSWLNPIVSIGQIALYGSAVILARELNIRFKGGIVSQFALCGLTGIIIEGLSVATWFDPNFSGLGAMKGFGIYAGTNWPWVFHLQMYHAVESTFIPILVAEMLFPQIPKESWLPKKPAIVLFSLGAVCVPLFRVAEHFPYTPLQIAICLTGIAIVLLAGWSLRNVRMPRIPMPRRSWVLGAMAVIGWLFYFIFQFRVFKGILPVGISALACATGLTFLFAPLAYMKSIGSEEGQWAWICGSCIFYTCLCFIMIFVKSPLELVNMTLDAIVTFLIIKRLRAGHSPRITAVHSPA